MKERGPLFSALIILLWDMATVAAILSGFAHLPVAYRYGIIDTWNTSPTVVHYWAAAGLLFLSVYAGVIWFGESAGRFRLSRWGWLRVILVVLLCVSGLLLVLHNLEEVSIHGGVYAVCKLGHLACAALFTVFLVIRCWLRLAGRGRCVLPVAQERRRR